MDKWGVDDKHWNDVACAALTALTPRSGTMVATLNDVLRDAAGLAPDASSRCVSRRPREIKEALARHLLKLTRPQLNQLDKAMIAEAHAFAKYDAGAFQASAADLFRAKHPTFNVSHVPVWSWSVSCKKGAPCDAAWTLDDAGHLPPALRFAEREHTERRDRTTPRFCDANAEAPDPESRDRWKLAHGRAPHHAAAREATGDDGPWWLADSPKRGARAPNA